MSSVATAFRTNEQVQVLCPVTKIWESGTVVAIEGSWAVRIKFNHWSGKHNTKIVIPKNLSKEKWVVRKTITKTAISRGASRRQNLSSKCTSSHLGYKVDRRQYLDVVHFVNNRNDDADISNQQPSKNKEVRMAWVVINDPFLEQMQVIDQPSIEDSNYPDLSADSEWIKYSQLRPPSWKIAKRSADEQEYSDSEKPVPKKTKVCSDKQGKISGNEEIGNHIPEVLNEAVADEEMTAHDLDVVPCQNGILEKGSKVETFGTNFDTERLFFETEIQTAMVCLKQTYSPLVTVQMPAMQVTLTDPSFRDLKLTKTSKHGINKAFILFSAIKRAIGMTVRKENWWCQRALIKSTPLIRKLLGLRENAQSVILSTLLFYSYFLKLHQTKKYNK